MPDTATTPGTALEATLELLDPAEITVRNIRSPKPSQRLIDSVRERGVRSPIGVLRTPDGELMLRFGDRRLQACTETGRQVLAVVIEGIAGTSEAEIERIFEQLDENDNREDLTVADRAGAVQALFELGAPAAVIARKTGLGKAEIAAARKIAASETARTLAAQYPLDLEQGAAIAEFEADPEAVTSLVEAAKEGHGRFAHSLQCARDERADRELIDAHAAELESKGIEVSSEGQGWENLLQYWTDADGAQLTPKTHRECPGNVVFLRVGRDQKVEERWFCTGPAANGHKSNRDSGGTGSAQSAEDAAAERKRVLAGNKAWRSAQKLRREWLRELFARPKVPDGALQYTLEAFARADHKLHRAMDGGSGGRHVMARELLGLPKAEGSTWDRVPEVYTAMTTASPARAQVIALAIVLGAHEGETDVHAWRSPSADTADYIAALVIWGYGLSDIERELVDAVRQDEAAAGA